jgi:Na+/melibiose symporter-like transporter
MKSIKKLFLILVTLTVACMGWITGQLRSRNFIILVLLLVSATLITFLFMNIHERRSEEKKRKQRESKSSSDQEKVVGKVKRSQSTFALREKKRGLTWGGGNIKASQATRGTKRKFLGR